MPSEVISIRVSEDYPLTGAEVKKLVEACPLLFTAARDNTTTKLFGMDPELQSIYNRLVLWMIKTKKITEDALR